MRVLKDLFEKNRKWAEKVKKSAPDFFLDLSRQQIPEYLWIGCSDSRVPDGVNMFSTSTRNFDDRIGNGAKVFLGSAELGAVTSAMGKLPTPAEYLSIYKEKIAPKADAIYKYLQFDEMAGYKKSA